MTEEELEKREEFGDKLKSLRIKKCFTQDYCAEKVGCTIRAWYRWENGIASPLPVYKSSIKRLFPELGIF